jgi:hypothetical protein
VPRAGRERVPVAILRADRRGRFDYAYRFRRTNAPFTHYFQARLERRPGYPYDSGASARAPVRVGP